MTKLRLKANQKSAVTFSVGNYRATFEPGEVLEVAPIEFAEYLLRQPEIVKATDADIVIEVDTGDETGADAETAADAETDTAAAKPKTARPKK